MSTSNVTWLLDTQDRRTDEACEAPADQSTTEERHKEWNSPLHQEEVVPDDTVTKLTLDHSFV
ncbi:hypothetical protein CSKR_200114 [Clonorchis sinensis]|uniref:Uncharacterized protein n=1 Tax=Clonorchis sinensis TaxID=79923 RepID=A0A8T1LZ40_CLOSI|nr:hypothetical protein CSKR_200114 [Clonorchis sinensis]